MKKQFKNLAKKAGFNLWGKEKWNPGDVIDWGGSRYDKELENFAELLLKQCIDLFENAKVNQEDDVDYGLEEAKQIIYKHFGVK